MTTPRLYSATLEEKFRARTVPVDGGHLMWTGSEEIRWNGRLLQASRVAFELRTGRKPVGYVRPDCGMHGCAAPDHVDDQPGRERTRAQLQAVRSFTAGTELCPAGHDQAVHGRTDRDGKPYCTPCAADGDRIRLALELQIRYYAGWSVNGLAADAGCSYSRIHRLLTLADTQFRPQGYVVKPVAA